MIPYNDDIKAACEYLLKNHKQSWDLNNDDVITVEAMDQASKAIDMAKLDLLPAGNIKTLKLCVRFFRDLCLVNNNNPFHHSCFFIQNNSSSTSSSSSRE